MRRHAAWIAAVVLIAAGRLYSIESMAAQTPGGKRASPARPAASAPTAVSGAPPSVAANPAAKAPTAPARQPSNAALAATARTTPSPGSKGANPAPAATALPMPKPPASVATARTGFDPTSRYVQKNLYGWQVMFHERLFKDQQELGYRVNALLWQQLHQIDFKLPAVAVSRLRVVKIWVEVNEPHFPCMVYHPNLDWLNQHGMNPDKVHGVEISNSRTFLSWSVMQPWIVLHELSHAYHDQVLGGFDNPDVKQAYDDAVASKLYDRVLFANGRPKRHYGMTNPQEFFAEQSEAFFGVNDYYPFVRAELVHYDPKTYEMLRQMWWKEFPVTTTSEWKPATEPTFQASTD